jgi:peptidoglycan hydrolase-like protein with peptidoglycan-binding domain
MKTLMSAVAVAAGTLFLAGSVLAQPATPSPPGAPATGDVKQQQKQGTAPATPAQRATEGAKERMGTSPTSEQVRQVQQALKDKGQDPGAIDGVMGAKTQAALKNYQQAEGLKPTGRLDAETMAKLGVSDVGAPSAAPRASQKP